MDAKDTSPEQWVSHADVQRLLTNILSMPNGDHRAAIQNVLGENLRAAHVHGLLRLLAPKKKADWKKPKWSGTATSSKAAAIHIWLYHLLDGRDKKLHAPEPPYIQTEFSQRLKLGLDAELDVKYKAALDAARAADRRDVRYGTSRVDDVRSAPFDPDWLRLRLVLPGGGTASSGGGGGGGGAAGDSTEWEQQSAALLAFAMGTHERLGIGYASRDEPCAIRRIANDQEV